MSHVDVKLESTEQVAPESAFYLTGKKSVNVVQVRMWSSKNWRNVRRFQLKYHVEFIF